MQCIYMFVNRDSERPVYTGGISLGHHATRSGLLHVRAILCDTVDLLKSY